MSPDLGTTIASCLLEIAPEADLATLRRDRPLRDQLDIDSFDFLNLLVAVHEATGVNIPESDYPKVATLDALLAYVKARVGA